MAYGSLDVPRFIFYQTKLADLTELPS